MAASWLPHGVTHTVYNNNIEHLLEGSHKHSPHEHNHDNNTDIHIGDHHPIHIDVVTYFSDYLNADLQRTTLNALDIPSFDVYEVDFFTLASVIEPHHYYDLSLSKSRVPLDWKISSSSNIPLYLSTLRLRI
ncbi:MAG: hypothetical protein ACJA04_000796 [Cellvibrionaceae bacterium]|jgi:hypothetical protein